MFLCMYQERNLALDQFFQQTNKPTSPPSSVCEEMSVKQNITAVAGIHLVYNR